MPAMTDQNRVNAVMQALFTSSTACNVTPGTGGGSSFSATPPYALRLMTVQGSNTSNGSQATSGNCPGYTGGGVSLGASAFAAPSGAIQVNSNPVSWNATGTWTAIPAIEIWDNASLRWLQGSLTSSISGVVNGDTVQFAAASITLNASSW